jgi:hypothetical protein
MTVPNRFFIKCDYGYFSRPISYWAPSWKSGWGKREPCPYICFNTVESAKESLVRFGTDWPNLVITDEQGNAIQ